ncbi:TIGR04282 family arsenosugar biosynthesis glycosyltransferase [Pseudomarimonas arenosa]|uniref:TIGR04282 family arsenosugar biosynthesis glycosyltransferase n=1 Tax=Pseudomarimonas arenosa TaxID=2774145 RepID=UPI001CDC9AB3|nr:DUF2064 domain-containing protein [Pseudomarimonas arenosa]
MSGGLAIFVKTPGRSPIKTRLAHSRGSPFAEHCHRLAAAAVSSVVQRFVDNSGWQAHWAVAEPGAFSQWSGLACMAQGEGGLGERMARVHGELIEHHGRALLIGADSPQLTVAHLDAAVRALDDGADHVLGPAMDGGFWLLASRCRIADTLWLAVPYSHPDTGRQMQAALSAAGTCARVDTLRDLDRAADLLPLLADLSALQEPTPAQQALIDWLGEALQNAPP